MPKNPENAFKSKKMKKKCGKICVYQKNIVILPHFLNDNTKFF